MPDLVILFQMLQHVLKDRTQLALEGIEFRRYLQRRASTRQEVGR